LWNFVVKRGFVIVLQEIFILNLKHYRNTRGFSQLRLATLCGTTASYIGEIEIGYKFPSIKMIEKIASALNMNPCLLFDDPSIPKLPISDIAKKNMFEQLTKSTKAIIEQYIG
jgi:transcriptional regulator with XRE-family HTH domain